MRDLDKKVDSKTPTAVAPLARILLTAGVSRRQVLKASLIGVGGVAAAAGRLIQLCGPLLAQTSSTAPALQSIQMMNALTGWAVTDQPDAHALLLTPDGGIHWIDVTPLNSSGQRISVDDVAVLKSLAAWVVSSEGLDPGPVFHTADGGQTWSFAAAPPSLWSVHFIDAQDGWGLTGVGALGSMEADIYRSTDAGATWTKVASTGVNDESSGLPFAGNKAGMTFLNTTRGWVTGAILTDDWMYLYRTDDGGRTWRQQRVPLPPQVAPHWNDWTIPPTFLTAQDGILPVFYVIKSDANIDIAAVIVVYVTHDGGTTWGDTTPVPITLGNGFSTSFADMNHGWVTDGDVLYVTTDGGSHWTTIPPTPPFANVKQIDFVSPQLGWAVTPTSLLKTEDGGSTWTPVVYTIVQ
jgi:photosystem II stability/assembly factor-like uncharacterized protein